MNKYSWVDLQFFSKKRLAIATVAGQNNQLIYCWALFLASVHVLCSANKLCYVKLWCLHNKYLLTAQSFDG